MIKVISAILIVAFYSLILATPTQFLWNLCLRPAVDGIHNIGFFQALGINLLFTILFKNSKQYPTPVEENEENN
jgi:hypothetical protein